MRRNEVIERIMYELKSKRKVARYTQRELVKVFNNTRPYDIRISNNDLSKYEKGVNIIPVDKYVKLMSILDTALTTPPSADTEGRSI